MCNTSLVNGDLVTFYPPLSSDAGSYWCRNRTNHSDIAEAILLFKGGHNYNQSHVHIIACKSVLESVEYHNDWVYCIVVMLANLFTILCGAIEMDSIIMFS